MTSPTRSSPATCGADRPASATAADIVGAKREPFIEQRRDVLLLFQLRDVVIAMTMRRKLLQSHHV